MKITSALLKRRNACEDQVILFEKLFPEGVEVTEELCIKYFDKFRWDWAAENLFPEDVLEEYERIEQPAWKEYERAIEPAWKEYKRTTKSAWKEYLRTTKSVREECGRVKASAFGKLAEKLNC